MPDEYSLSTKARRALCDEMPGRKARFMGTERASPSKRATSAHQRGES